LDWNHNGSLIGVTTKEKLVHILDPRGNKIEMSCKGHDHGKSQKMHFLGNTDYVFSCGSNLSNERQIKLYDLRNFTKAVQTLAVDQQTGVMIPFYDPDTGLIYVPGRGEGNIKYFEFTGNHTVVYANQYSSSVPQKGLAAFPKRAMNYNKCEVQRFAKLTINTIEYLSFYVPKRNEGYDASVYPDCISGEPSLTVEEWTQGANKDAIRKPITSLDLGWTASEGGFDKKSETKTEFPQTNNLSGEYESKISELQKVLSDEIEKRKYIEEENLTLKARVEELTQELEALKSKTSGHHVEEPISQEEEEVKVNEV